MPAKYDGFLCFCYNLLVACITKFRYGKKPVRTSGEMIERPLVEKNWETEDSYAYYGAPLTISGEREYMRSYGYLSLDIY